MMNKIFFLGLFIISLVGFSQGDEMPNDIHDVINWSQKVDYNGNEATLTFTVDQKDGWHVYAQEQPAGAVAYPTEFFFTKSPDYSLIGNVKETGTELHGGQFPEKYFPGKKAIFKQKIKINTAEDFILRVDYVYMACKEACFQPTDEYFEIKIKGSNQETTVIKDDKVEKVEEVNPDEPELAVTVDSVETLLKSPIGIQSYIEKKSETNYILVIKPIIKDSAILLDGLSFSVLTPVKLTGEFTSYQTVDTVIKGVNRSIYVDGAYRQEFMIDTSKHTDTVVGTILFSGLLKNGQHFESLPSQTETYISEAVTVVDTNASKGNSHWGIFWLAFGGGLFALLTPCVFPMIPMTVSFFTKGSEDKKKGLFRGVMYGFFIFLIYVLLSVPFHLMDSLNPNILNNIATNGPLNIFFFIMLFIFGLSFLGAFEIVLPAKWTNKADTKSDLGGLIGIFFMALTLALVSFSCTGPILGSLLANAAGGGAWNLTWGMAGFGVALGLPFALFAIFPSWLNQLPSSGGWLNNVKVVLGFLEIAFAFKFLSNADLSIQAHLLERELFLAIWIAIFAAMTMYLFGLYQTKHDSPIKGGLGTFRIIVASLSLMLTIYMIPGLFGAPVKLISAFPPPPSYSEIPYGIHGYAPNDLPEGAEFEHGLTVFHDLDQAKKYAKKLNKPVMIDFTGLNCVNCRKMETNVWSNENIHKIMEEDFVIVSLYVDEKTDLETPEISPYSNRKLLTKGDKWSDLQSSVYDSNTQPQYVALDKDGNKILGDANYRSHGEVGLFKNWLEDAHEFYSTKTLYGSIVLK